jgi:hypothetical protein
VTDVRALTVKRPWPGLMFHGKNVENRSWDTSYRGPLLIHAGQGWDGAAEAWFDSVFAPFLPDDFWQPDRHPTGIVAVAELTGICSDVTGDCDCGPWAMRWLRHWRLENVRALPEPIPAKGTLGLWRPEPGVVEAALAGVAS